MPRKSSRPTVATIARDLGISPATVSYALNDKPGVSAAMRARVLEHASAIGWTPHSGAQALRRGRSGNIGLVLVRDPEELSREPFYSAVTAGIEAATSAHGFELLIRFVRGGADDEVDVFRAWSHQRRVDGVVLLDLAKDDHRPPVLEALSLDFAVLGHYSGPEDFVKVTTAEPADAATVIDHLLERGYDGCLQLTGPFEYAHEGRRRELLARLCAERGIPHLHVPGTYTVDSGYRAFQAADTSLSARPAVVTSSDLIAVGALRAAAAQGVAIPRDLGLVSWDDSLIAEVTSPSITALSRRPFDMGRAAGDLLAQKIDGRIPGGSTIENSPAALIPRGSTARP
ncbi:LacI family transcriptional regulator [Brachybacterium avium]|uniref:LacI family transcriptional regulator n=1 Tax=Brachybacterium avium TaxID=2017485 RepID=A0A220UDR3_9MICO|nr:LacI family DNA-binding transcriptional regulator [Brachybacterium avium]ASK66091.1 LacI family transcriptional regulator [Brachybacterium avium]